MGKQKSKKANSLWLKAKTYLNKNLSKAIYSIIGVLGTLIITKACNKIMPDSPLVIEKTPDTIKIIHVYEPLSSSIKIDENTTKDIESTILGQEGKQKKEFSRKNINKVTNKSFFPNAKGYTVKSAAPYFMAEMIKEHPSIIDFEIHFFDEKFISDICCLSIKICKIQDNRKICILEENYEKNRNQNTIRLNNNWGPGEFDIEIGFFLTKDKNSKYPNFYREIKHIKN